MERGSLVSHELKYFTYFREIAKYSSIIDHIMRLGILALVVSDMINGVIFALSKYRGSCRNTW